MSKAESLAAAQKEESDEVTLLSHTSPRRLATVLASKLDCWSLS